MAKSKFKGYRIRVCFGDIDPKVPWHKLGYIAWHERSERYMKAGKKQTRCEHGRYHWPDEPCRCRLLAEAQSALADEVTT